MVDAPVEESGHDSTDDTRWLIVGLGNPGAEYEGTYHNVGFRVVDILAGRRKDRFVRHMGPSQVAQGDRRAILVKPMTYMNASGRVLSSLFGQFGQEMCLCAVSDDLALPLGRIRVRERGSAGGHNGLESISSAYGSNEYVRVRVGIGTDKPFEARDYVLSVAATSDRDLLADAEQLAADAVECLMSEGTKVAMSRYNGRDLRGSLGNEVNEGSEATGENLN